MQPPKKEKLEIESSESINQSSIESITKTNDIYNISSNLPERFKDPNSWKYKNNKKNKHPCYITTSSQYGSIQPSIHEMPKVFYGSSSNLQNVSYNKIY